MKITKEDSVEYLETLENLACINATCCNETALRRQENKILFRECINHFEQLIKEHFDNPPLTFEELKVGMWVWFCEDSSYVKILSTITLNGVQIVGIGPFCNMERIIEFDSTKFHLREVK